VIPAPFPGILEVSFCLSLAQDFRKPGFAYTIRKMFFLAHRAIQGALKLGQRICEWLGQSRRLGNSNSRSWAEAVGTHFFDLARLQEMPLRRFFHSPYRQELPTDGNRGRDTI